MRQEVFVRFAHGSEFMLPVATAQGMTSEEARRWLDEQFVANECEPLRATGKVLTADKVLALAPPERRASNPTPPGPPITPARRWPPWAGPWCGSTWTAGP